MNDFLKRTIQREEINSAILGSSRSLKVYLPPGYNDLLSYPVVYCQDGNDFFTMGRIATISNQLILEEDVAPFIVVGVSVERSRRTSEYAADGENTEAYKRFFCEEMIPFIEERYPIRREAKSRILAGDSLGGTVSLHIALDYPELFANILSLSGAYFPSSIDRMEEEADLSWLRMWMIVGLDETDVETSSGTFDFVQFNRRAKLALEQRNCDLHYVEKPGNHTWGLWQKELPDGLRHFFAPDRLA